MSNDQPAVSGELETGHKRTGMFEIGADSIGVDPKEEKKAEIQASIDKKTKLASGLRATAKEKFDEFKKLKADWDAERATMQRLKIAGNLKLSDKDLKDSERYNNQKLEEAGRDAQRYREDAEALEKEIEELNAKLGKDRN